MKKTMGRLIVEAMDQAYAEKMTEIMKGDGDISIKDMRIECMICALEQMRTSMHLHEQYCPMAVMGIIVDAKKGNEYE